MTDQKPTGVFIRLPLTGEQLGKFQHFRNGGCEADTVLNAIGTPFLGGTFETVGWVAPGLFTHFGKIPTGTVISSVMTDSRTLPLIRQSDALAKLAEKDAEIARYRDALIEAKTFHEEQDKSLSKQPPSSPGSWRRNQHQEQIEFIDEALKGGEDE